ncbi:hypothetical protein D9Q98_002968 [Chlorella vulgaris]|uniref:Uncharacterized protein n=1 Tax=Chlorella vulgaris TaxID=3077 RepID=A0A9D4TU92_CHLVU|nr:hypothetical protein D9Q98_002968 [Chlorella vulgaris]
MLTLRQQLRGLVLLAEAAQRHSAASVACSVPPGRPWQLQALAGMHSSRSLEAQPLAGITQWLAQRMPASLGGIKDGELDIETFASSITQARRLGGLTGFVHGTSAISDSTVQGGLRLFEHIIGAMRPEEKKDLALFDRAARQRVAAEARCTTGQVDDCIARFLWTQQMTRQLAALKKEGKELPNDMAALEARLGTWRSYKTEHDTADGGSAAAVPLAHLDAKGKPCGLAGMPVGKNTKCPTTKRSFKACCGKSLRLV